MIACGNNHTLAVIDDIIYSCGNNEFGQLGLENDIKELNKFTPLKTFPPLFIKSISCGESHSIVLTKDIIWSCGENFHGQLGLGDNAHRYCFTSNKIIPTPKKVFCAESSTFVLTENSLLCCGYNKFGQLGLDTDKNYSTFVPTLTFIDASKIILVAPGPRHTIVLTTQGLWGSGSNFDNQLGIPEVKGSYKFIENKLVSNGISVACGSQHSLLLTKDGLFGCGNNYGYQLGDKDRKYIRTFTKIKFFEDLESNILSITCGYTYSMVLTTYGLWASGKFRTESIKYHDSLYGFTPIDLSYLNPGPENNIIKLINGYQHNFLITNDYIFSSGSNSSGELGQGYKDSDLVGFKTTKRKFRPITFDK